MPTIRQAAIDDIIAAKPGAKIVPNYSNLYILATILSNEVNDLYGYLDYISKQSVPWTATDEALYGWGALRGAIPNGDTAASGPITFAGCVPASSLPDGTVLSRSDGVLYAVKTFVTVPSSGIVTAAITCLTRGAVGNLPAGAVLSLQSGVDGITGTGTCGAIVGGADGETDDAFRSRMLPLYSRPPQGGCLHDYIEWATAIPGVTRAWALGNIAGAGTVTVWTMLDNAEAGNDGFAVGTDGVAAAETRAVAATGDQLTVANALYPLRPVTALVYSLAPTPYPVDITINNLAKSAAVEAGIAAALTAVFLSSADPIGGTIYPSSLELAIGSVPGVGSFTLASPVQPITAPVGSLPVLGSIVYG